MLRFSLKNVSVWGGARDNKVRNLGSIGWISYIRRLTDDINEKNLRDLNGPAASWVHAYQGVSVEVC